MPASGVSVDAVDPVFQAKMMDMLRQIGRYLGWWDVDGVPFKTRKVSMQVQGLSHSDWPAQ